MSTEILLNMKLQRASVDLKTSFTAIIGDSNVVQHHLTLLYGSANTLSEQPLEAEVIGSSALGSANSLNDLKKIFHCVSVQLTTA